MTTAPVASRKPVQPIDRVVIRFAGDSGDGMQLTGDRFTAETASLGNDLATLPNFPAEIRAPQGTLPGVSSFQLHFADHEVLTPGDAPDVLVAMNPAALKANLRDLPRGAVIILDSDEFTKRNLTKVGYAGDPRDDGSLDSYRVHALPLTSMTVKALQDLDLTRKEAERAKNMFALGMLSWLYSRPTEPTEAVPDRQVPQPAAAARGQPSRVRGRLVVRRDHRGLRRPVRGRARAGPRRHLPERHRQHRARLRTGRRRAPRRAAAGPRFLPDHSGVRHPPHAEPAQAVRRDDAAGRGRDRAIGMALGAAFGGAVGVTSTSGPGLALKSETIGLAVSLELPLVVVDVQRGGPSTGLPTKTEQADLLQAMFGRNSESPVAIVAPRSPADCFEAAIEAVRIATTYRTPVLLLSDGYLANGSEPWLVPSVQALPDLGVEFAKPSGDGPFRPYDRDPLTLARPWAPPGVPGLEHRIGGIEKADGTGEISYDPDNHDRMVRLRQAKIDGIDVPPLEVDDPDGDAELLVLGWGSTFGPISAAARAVRETGIPVATAHLRHLNPFPANTGEIVRRYRKLLVPEMNLGQLALLLRARYLVDAVGYNRVRGVPFTSAELADAIRKLAQEEQ